MTPAQHAAYEAVCSADPECRCPHVSISKKGVWCDSLGSITTISLAAAAITDHLHTRIYGLQAVGQVVPSCCMDGGGWWEVVNPKKSPVEMLETCLKSKLSAYLAAHIVRLSLPRELIRKMEEA